jgi:hypothetical protein
MKKQMPAALSENEMVQKTIAEVHRKIVFAYSTRDDYPPYALTAWDDRTRFQTYVLKLIDEVGAASQSKQPKEGKS